MKDRKKEDKVEENNIEKVRKRKEEEKAEENNVKMKL